MGKLLVTVLVIAAAWFVLGKLGMVSALPLPEFAAADPGVREEAGILIVNDPQAEARYRIGGDISGDYMAFGGTGTGDHATGHATVMLIGASEVRSLASRLPDFAKCASDGAPETKEAIQRMTFVAPAGSTRELLAELGTSAIESMHSDKTHLCVHLDGSALQLESLRRTDKASDGPDELPPRLQQVHFYYARRAGWIDCATLVH